MYAVLIDLTLKGAPQIRNKPGCSASLVKSLGNVTQCLYSRMPSR